MALVKTSWSFKISYRYVIAEVFDQVQGNRRANERRHHNIKRQATVTPQHVARVLSPLDSAHFGTTTPISFNLISPEYIQELNIWLALDAIALHFSNPAR